MRHFWLVSDISVCCHTAAWVVPPPQHHPQCLISYTAVSSLETVFKAAFGQRGELRHEIETQLAHVQLGNPCWKWWWSLISSLCLSSACQPQQGSTALPSSSTAPDSGTGQVWLRVCPPGSALLGVCTVAGAVTQRALSKRTWAWQLLFHGPVAIRHFYTMTFVFGGKYGILCCLNCNIAFTLVINPSYVPAMGLQSALRLNSHFHLNWPVVIYWLSTRTDAPSQEGQAVTPLRQIPLSAVLTPLFLRLHSLPGGTLQIQACFGLIYFQILEGSGSTSHW